MITSLMFLKNITSAAAFYFNVKDPEPQLFLFFYSTAAHYEMHQVKRQGKQIICTSTTKLTLCMQRHNSLDPEI